MDKTTAPKSAIGFLIGWSAEFLRRPLPGGLASRARCIIGAWSVSPCCLSPAGNGQYCLDKAVECDRKAAQARDPNAAKEFQSLAARWRVAAATRDFNHKVEDILRTLREAASS
jgi:hypothetical protein